MQVWIDADDGLYFRVSCTEVVHKGLKEGQEFIVLSTVELPTKSTPFRGVHSTLLKGGNQTKERAYFGGSPWGCVLFILFYIE